LIERTSNCNRLTKENEKLYAYVQTTFLYFVDGAGDAKAPIARVTPEGLPASQELIQNHTEDEEIRSAVDPVPFTSGLLGLQIADETVTDTLQSGNVVLPFVP
jgi:hypothetical protein